MRLTAAAAHPATAVRSFVMASSTRVYPVSSRAARLHPESEALQPGRGTLSASLVEAEGYVRDLATTSPNLSASIMRLANLACPGADDPLPALLASPIVPAVWGFDPSVQLLNIDDAVTALEHAADHDLAGVYNVGADELVRWRRAIRLAGKPHIELPVAPTGTLTRLIQWPYRLTVGDDVVNELKFGRAAATDAITRSGFRPTMTSARLASVRQRQSALTQALAGEVVQAPACLTSWNAAATDRSGPHDVPRRGDSSPLSGRGSRVRV